MWASDELQADREGVLAAVGQDGESLQYAAAALRADREVVREAVAHGGSLRHTVHALRADPELLLLSSGSPPLGREP